MKKHKSIRVYDQHQPYRDYLDNVSDTQSTVPPVGQR